MNIRQLETLIWICRLGSVRKAADRLGASQPAASARIRELEEELGINLLMRDKRPIRIAPQGREVLRLAESMVELADRMKRYANEARPIYGTVRLGANHGVASSWLPSLLHSCYDRLPGVEIELVVELTDKLAELLRTGKLDIAFTIGRIDDPAIGYSRLYDVELEWVASRRCAGVPDPVTPAGIARFPVLTDAEGSLIQKTVVAWFRAAGVQPRRLDICSGPQNRLSLAAEGEWLTVVPSTILPAYSRSAEFVRLGSEPPLEPMEMGVAWRLASEVGDTLKHVMPLARTVIDAWTRDGRRVVHS